MTFDVRKFPYIIYYIYYYIIYYIAKTLIPSRFAQIKKKNQSHFVILSEKHFSPFSCWFIPKVLYLQVKEKFPKILVVFGNFVLLVLSTSKHSKNFATQQRNMIHNNAPQNVS